MVSVIYVTKMEAEDHMKEESHRRKQKKWQEKKENKANLRFNMEAKDIQKTQIKEKFQKCFKSDTNHTQRQCKSFDQMGQRLDEHIKYIRLHESRREKTGLQGFRSGLTQTRLYTHRRMLDAGNLKYK